MSANTQKNTSEPGIGRIISYGFGDFAFNLSFTFCSLFLLYFYTDILEIKASVAGMIIMIALAWEGFTDPIIGMIANRTSTKWGKYRPYLLFGCIPLAISIVAMFVPTGLTGTALVVYCFVTHLIYRTLFTVVNIPYIAMSAQMTRSSDTRGKLAAARMIFAIICGLMLAALTLPLSNTLGGGKVGFFYLSIVYASIATLILLFCFSTTKEVVKAESESHPSAKEMIKMLGINRPFLLLFIATILGATGYTMSGKALIYYLKYWAGSEAAVTTGLVVTLGAAALAMVPWVLISRKTSKRLVWIASVAINILCYLVFLLVAPKEGLLLWSLLFLIGIGNAGFILTFWSMLPDTVEYGQWKTGVRAEGAIFGLIAFAQKVALGLGTGLIGVFLDSIGYIANQPQSEGTLQGIVSIYGGGPLLLFLASVVAIWAYPINQKTHLELVEALDSREVNRDFANNNDSLPGNASTT
ncbi:MFS transporter [Microbulbifer sp. SH-1]|uniref:MFS transporter n=1 Tax=Microbulbifer sp. SH-1 TaxID=2681547 RepID=UPI00140B4EFF|nr:glycoside-pentoside-hexuronide (GPH):cation symporter [Microbulbifer sp. SH-1]QIL91260.1 MFS transporter [Microbulbifer sp. SH-1]